MKSISPKWALIASACALLLGGCGGGSGGGIAAAGSVVPASAGVPDDGALKAMPGPDGTMTFGVSAGASRRQQALQALDFFPGTITVDVGDSITWTNGGNAHTITFGTPPANLNPNAPYGGSTYDGSTFTSSGFTTPGQTYTLTFTKAGTYPYFCIFHAPEMSGVVVVQPKGAPYPVPYGSYVGQARSEEASQLSGAQSALALFPYATGGTTVTAGISPGLAGGMPPSNSTVLRFQDAPYLSNGAASTVVTVKVGTTITWVNQTNNEPHTVTFPVAGQPLPNIDPFAPPSGPSSYDGSTLVNSGPFGSAVGFPGNSLQPDVHQSRNLHVLLPLP